MSPCVVVRLVLPPTDNCVPVMVSVCPLPVLALPLDWVLYATSNTMSLLASSKALPSVETRVRLTY